jgi:hypothetical protein
MTRLALVLALAAACGGTTSSSDGGPTDGASEATSDTAGDSPACEDACSPTFLFTPAMPAACSACIDAKCAQQLSGYEGSCSNVIQGACTCAPVDDSCYNERAPYEQCVTTSCAAECASVGDAGGPG